MNFNPFHFGHSVRPGYWFALRHGMNFRVVPATWQAWLCCAIYLALLLAAIWRLPRGHGRSLAIAILTIAMIAVALIETDWTPT